MTRRLVAAVCALLLALTTRGAGAQLDPRGDWRTLRTPHFRVHFRPTLEEQGRRAAANAERAYALLARELHEPRGPIDVVLADNVDYSNGFATTFPSNRIVLYAQPPVHVSSLRFYDDWNAQLITHELTHIFHLDRSRGVWRAAQYVFGRNPALFPNNYTPAWLTEGLAVYYESRLTGSGRIASTEHRMIARSAAAQDRVPRIDQFSLESSVFPGGSHAYAYGSLLVDHLARTRGAETVGRFVERVSGQLVPYRLNRAARRTFGESFDDAWRSWRDSLRAGMRDAAGAATPWRELTREGWYAEYPRWRDSSRIVYAANDGRSMTGVMEVGVDGGRDRLARRNSLSPNVPLPDGSLLFAQLDYVDAFDVRGDLYVQRGGTEHRLTRDARLSHPDARGDGPIVAVQSLPGTTRLVLVSRNGRTITPITRASADTQYAEPRWSPDGRRIAAVQLARGGFSAVVLLDSAGGAVGDVVRDRSVNSAPSWSADGRAVYFASDRTGAAELYVATVDSVGGTTGVPRRLGGGGAGVFTPAPSPDGRSLAAMLYRVDGYHLAVGPAPDGGTTVAASGSTAASHYPQTSTVTATAESDTSALSAYSPWRTLLPRYWLPITGEADDARLQVGALTSGADVLRRHAYSLQAVVNTGRGDVEGDVSYRYARFGQPLVDAGGSQTWDYFSLTARRQGGALDTIPLARRTRVGSLALTFVRPRYRTSASFSVGAQLEARGYETESARVRDAVEEQFGTTFPAVFVSAGWSNTQRPTRSISPEDGVALSASAQQRWQRGAAAGQARRVVGVARAYKSLDLPGFAHHVLAVRVAGGVADRNSTSDFSVGGASGSRLELLPGVLVGEPARTFGTRGFAPSTQRGLRALAASAEYRLPLTVPARGLRLLPVFLDRVSASAFVDAASAWCPAAVRENPECGEPSAVTPTSATWLAAAGAELNLDAALQYDRPYRFRFGVAAPVAARERAPGAVSAYFTLGLAF